jgi:hypothetical protein
MARHHRAAEQKSVLRRESVLLGELAQRLRARYRPAQHTSCNMRRTPCNTRPVVTESGTPDARAQLGFRGAAKPMPSAADFLFTVRMSFTEASASRVISWFTFSLDGEEYATRYRPSKPWTLPRADVRARTRNIRTRNGMCSLRRGAFTHARARLQGFGLRRYSLPAEFDNCTAPRAAGGAHQARAKALGPPPGQVGPSLGTAITNTPVGRRGVLSPTAARCSARSVRPNALALSLCAMWDRPRPEGAQRCDRSAIDVRLLRIRTPAHT